MSHNQYPPAPPAPPPFPNAMFPPASATTPPQANQFGPQRNSLPFEQLAGLQIDPNGQRIRATGASVQSAELPEVIVRYEGVTLRKDPNPPFGVEPSWSRVKETRMSKTNEEIIKIGKKNKENVQRDLKSLLSDKQRMQIDQLVEERKAFERHPNAEWVLVSVVEERGERKKVNETETKALHIVLKRQQKPKANDSTNIKRDTRAQADIPGIVRDLNMPRGQNAPQQIVQPSYPRAPHQVPIPMATGSLHQPGERNFNPNVQVGAAQAPRQQGPPPAPHPQGGPMGIQQVQFSNAFPGPRPVTQPNLSNNPNFSPTAAPVAIPTPGPVKQKTTLHKNRPSDDDIVHIVDDDLSAQSKHGHKNYKRMSNEKSKEGVPGRHRSSTWASASSDDEDSSHQSRTSEDFTNITTPTSGTGSFPRGIERPKSGHQRRNSGIDYMADIRDRMSRDRPGGRSRRHSRDSVDLLDDYGEIHRRNSLERDIDSHERRTSRPFYGDRSVSDALYKPQRRMTAMEQLDRDYLCGLERIRRDEDARLEQRLRERGIYERERKELRPRSPFRYRNFREYSPSRYDRRH